MRRLLESAKKVLPDVERLKGNHSGRKTVIYFGDVVRQLRFTVGFAEAASSAVFLPLHSK